MYHLFLDFWAPQNFDFTIFNNEYKRLMQKDAPDSSFLTWLVGFAEGDGSFIVMKRGSFAFVITQDTRDIQILNMIQRELGLGKVIKQGKTTSRFVVQDKKGLYLKALLFNGNLVTYSRIESFLRFLPQLNKYNQQGSLIFPKIDPVCTEWSAGLDFGEFPSMANPSNNRNTMLPIRPTLEDNWLCGFIDSEGCFSVSIKRKTGFNICFDIAQKRVENRYILEHLKNLFTVGKIYMHCQAEVFYYRVHGLKNVANLFSYLDIHPLRSKKLKSYILWKDLHGRLLKKDHLNPTLRDSLRVLASKVNNSWD